MSSAPSSLAEPWAAAPPPRGGPSGTLGAPWLALALLAVGAALASARIGYRLSTGLWQTEDHAYSPMILAAAIWLVWRQRALFRTERSLPANMALILMAGALVLNLFSVLINNLTVAVATLLLAMVAGAAGIWGWRPIRRLGFPILTAAFCTPLPGSLIAAVTFPLKMAVSAASTRILSILSFPVERQGVMIELGDYRLLVADACSGIQSMFSLAAAATVYIALMEYRSPFRLGVLLATILPIAVAANIARVLILAFITYFFGDAAGQGFLHGFAGILMFVVAFALIMGVDAVLTKLKVAS